MRMTYTLLTLLALGVARADPPVLHPSVSIDCWIDSGWLHVRQKDPSGGTLWHTVLCRVTDPKSIHWKQEKDALTIEAPGGTVKTSDGWVRLQRERKPLGTAFVLEPVPPGAVEDGSMSNEVGHYRTLVAPREVGYIEAGPAPGIIDFFGRKGIVSADGRECVNTGSAVALLHTDFWANFLDDGKNLYFWYQSPEFMSIERHHRDLKAPNAPVPALKISHTFVGGTKDIDLTTPGLTLVDFWSTRCPPCVANLPAVEKLARDFKAKGLRTVSCHSSMLGGTVATIEAFLKKHPTEVHSVLVDRATDIAWGIISLPSYFLVKGGHIVAGPTSDVPLPDQIEKLLKAH